MMQTWARHQCIKSYSDSPIQFQLRIGVENTGSFPSTAHASRCQACYMQVNESPRGLWLDDRPYDVVNLMKI